MFFVFVWFFHREQPCSKGHPRATCSHTDEHRKNHPINQRLLSRFTIDDFDERYQSIAPRIIYLVGTHQYPNVEYALLTKRALNSDYGDQIVQALGWTVSISNDELIQNCESNIGAHFSPTPEPAALANIAPSKITTQYDYFGKYGEIIKTIETSDYDVSSQCLKILTEDAFIEPFLKILDLWSMNLDALTMSKYIVLVTWFGKEMDYILNGLASAVMKMELKHVLQVCCVNLRLRCWC